MSSLPPSMSSAFHDESSSDYDSVNDAYNPLPPPSSEEEEESLRLTRCDSLVDLLPVRTDSCVGTSVGKTFWGQKGQYTRTMNAPDAQSQAGSNDDHRDVRSFGQKSLLTEALAAAADSVWEPETQSETTLAESDRPNPALLHYEVGSPDRITSPRVDARLQIWLPPEVPWVIGISSPPNSQPPSVKWDQYPEKPSRLDCAAIFGGNTIERRNMRYMKALCRTGKDYEMEFVPGRWAPSVSRQQAADPKLDNFVIPRSATF